MSQNGITSKPTGYNERKVGNVVDGADANVMYMGAPLMTTTVSWSPPMCGMFGCA